MKLRLIQPGQLDEAGRPVKYRKLFMPFLTMPTLAALTPEGIEVGITEDFVETIDYDEEVDVVAIGGQTSQAPRAYRIADEFRRRGRTVVMGGIHASMCPEEALEHADAVMVGEAEDMWEPMLEDVRTGSLKPRYRAACRPDLSRLAIPRFDLLDYNNYVVPPFARTPLIPIQTTRGCPHNCDFCSVAAFLGNRVRKKPVENVLREIETIRPSRVFFTDDNIAADTKHARKLFAALTPLRLRWACQMDTLILKHPELIELAAEAGCHETFIGVESVSTETLAKVNKGFNRPETFAELFRRLKDVGILAQASMVYGMDGDDMDALRRTVDLVRSWDVNYLYIFVLTPYPGTPLFRQMSETGRIRSTDWSLFDGANTVVDFASGSAQDLVDAMWHSYEKFYSLPAVFGRLWRFGTQYVRFFPRDSALEELFFQIQMRRAIRRRTHPFSLGLRVSDGIS